VGDSSPPHDELTIHQARQLTGGRAVDGFVELDEQARMFAGREIARDPSAHRRRAISQLDAVDAAARALQPRPANRHVRRVQGGTRPNEDPVTRRILLEHVERLATADTDSAALSNGVVMLPAMRPDDGASSVDERTASLAESAVARKEASAPGAGEEAQIL
jgi:hypothetical protein